MNGHHINMSSQEKEKIIKDFLPSVRYLAYRLSFRLPPQISVDDLISVGLIGLYVALERFEQGKTKLRTYAQHRIKGAMLDELRAAEGIPRSLKEKVNALMKIQEELEKKLNRRPEDEELAEALNISMDEYYHLLEESKKEIIYKFNYHENTSEGDPVDLDDIQDPNGKDPLTSAIQLDQRKIMVGLINELPEKEKSVISLYYWEEMTMKEVGAHCGMTESRVCQLHNQALIRLRTKIDLLMN